MRQSGGRDGGWASQVKSDSTTMSVNTSECLPLSAARVVSARHANACSVHTERRRCSEQRMREEKRREERRREERMQIREPRRGESMQRGDPGCCGHRVVVWDDV